MAPDVDQILSLTEHEFQALASFDLRAPARRSLAVLGLPPEPSPEIRRAGIQTLLLRELARLEGDLVLAQGPAQVVAGIVTEATGWAVVTTRGAQKRSVVTVISAPGANVLVAMHPSGVHGVRPVDPQMATIDIVARIVGAAENNDQMGRPVAQHVHLLDATDERSVEIVLAEDGTWHGLDAAGEGSFAEVWGAAAQQLVLPGGR